MLQHLSITTGLSQMPECMNPSDAMRLLLVLLDIELASLVGGNLGLDTLLLLLLGELESLVLERLGLPFGDVLLGGLEGRVFTDSLVGVGVDLLNVVRSNTVSKVGRELLLESVRFIRY